MSEKQLLEVLHEKGRDICSRKTAAIVKANSTKNCVGFDLIGVDYNEYLLWTVQNQIYLSGRTSDPYI